MRVTRLSALELDLTISPAPATIMIVGGTVTIGPRTVKISSKLTLVLEEFDPNGECVDGEVVKADFETATPVDAAGGGDVVRRVEDDVRGRAGRPAG